MVVVILLMVVGVVSYVSNESGTVVVEAMSSPRYSPSVSLHVRATLGSSTQITPFNLTMRQGIYTISFAPASWFTAPNSRTVTVSGGRAVFSIGTYVPIIKVISVSQAGLNASVISALHNITPVVWVNTGSSVIVLQVDTFPGVYVQPSQNHTIVFPTPGRFNFHIFNTDMGGYVQVS